MLAKIKQVILDPHNMLFAMLFVTLVAMAAPFGVFLSANIQAFVFYFLTAIILFSLASKIKQNISKYGLVFSSLFFLPSLFVLFALISTIFSPAPFYAFFAYLNNADSLLVLFLLLLLFQSLHISFGKGNFYNSLLKVLQWAFIISFALIALSLLSSFTNLFSFSAPSLSLTEYSIFAALVLILSVLQEGKNKKEAFIKYIASTTAIVSLVLINTYISWIVLLAGSVLAIYFSFKAKLAVKSWVLAALLLLSLVFTFFGAQIANLSVKYTGILANPEPKPSVLAGMMIMQNAYNDSIKNKLVGTGPANFTFDWFKYKSNDARSAGVFWDSSFNSSSNSVLHFLTVFGVLGGVLWIALLFAIFSYVFRFSFSANYKRLSNNTVLSSYLALFVLSVSFLLYSPSLVFLTLFFVFLANFILALREKSLLKTFTFSKPLLRLKANTAPWALRAFAVAALYVAFSIPLSVALLYLKSTAGDISDYEKYSKIALYSLPVRAPIYDDLANIASAKLRQEVAVEQVQESDGKGGKLTQLSYVTDMLNYLDKARKAEPDNFRRYLALASAQALRYSISKDEADYKAAENSLAMAAKLAPQHPYVYFTASYLASAKGDYEGMKRALIGAITLKPDFKDAYNTLFDAALIQNNIKEAVAVAQLEVQNNPRDLGAWKRLAVAFLNNKQYKEAELTIKQILNLYPQGVRMDSEILQILVLALNKQGKDKEALERLKELSKRFKNDGIDQMIENLTKALNKKSDMQEYSDIESDNKSTGDTNTKEQN